MQSVDFIHRAIDKYIIQLDGDFDEKRLKGKFDDTSKKIKLNFITKRNSEIKNEYLNTENSYKKRLNEIKVSIKEINNNISLVIDEYNSEKDNININENQKSKLKSVIELKDKILLDNRLLQRETKIQLKETMDKAIVDISLRKINKIIDIVNKYKEQISKVLISYTKKTSKIGFESHIEDIMDDDVLPLFEKIEAYVMKYLFRDKIYDKEWLQLKKNVIKGIDKFKDRIDVLIEEDCGTGCSYLIRQAYDNSVTIKMLRFKMLELKKIKVNLNNEYTNLKLEFENFIKDKDEEIKNIEKLSQIIMEEYNKEVLIINERLANPSLTESQRDYCNNFLDKISKKLEKIQNILDIKIEAQ